MPKSQIILAPNSICQQCPHTVEQHIFHNWVGTCNECSCIWNIHYPLDGYKSEPEHTETLHFSNNKPGVDQIPPSILFMIGDVFSYGEIKYGRDNWKKGTAWHEFIGSALRHFYSFCMGQWLDEESKLPHLAHSIVNIMFLIYYHENKVGTDDRDKTSQGR